ncbi:cellulose binding domain-containing protein [Anaerocolumna jejuensis]|uniref:cellulose binding domain-containing protein n=1 Tax=Anaerocolumna jejuensis TaxID=259063 RepID=UPI003F7C8D18
MEAFNYGKRKQFTKVLFKKGLSLLLCITIILTGIPFTAEAAQKKFIKAEPSAFVPSAGEKAKITFNLESEHVLDVKIMQKGKVIAYLAKGVKYEGKYKTHELTWDGKDTSGSLVKNGTYQVVAEPQEEGYRKFKSITTVTAIKDNSKDISVAPYPSGSTLLVYGKGGKKQGVSRVSLTYSKDGGTGKTITATVGDNLWYAPVSMSAYSLYSFSAAVTSSSGSSTEKMTALRHVFRVTDRMEYLAGAYFDNYKKDSAILTDNNLANGYTNDGILVGSNILILNPTGAISGKVKKDSNLTGQHLGIIDQLQRTASENPVSLSMGNNFYENEDITVEGFQPLTFSRVYNSLSHSFHEFGMAWSDSYSYHLQDMGKTVAIQFEDGHLEYYTKSGDGYTTAEGLVRKLVKGQDGSFTLAKDKRDIYHFDPDGKLVTIKDLNDNTITLSYTDGLLSKIQSLSGYLDLTYNTDGSLKNIKDGGGRTVSYTYSNGELTGYTDVNGNKTTYSYDIKGRLTKAVSPEGVPLLAVTYDDNDRVLTKTLQGGTYQYSYDDDKRTITCTEPNGNKTLFRYSKEYRIESEENSDGTKKYYYKDGSKTGANAAASKESAAGAATTSAGSGKSSYVQAGSVDSGSTQSDRQAAVESDALNVPFWRELLLTDNLLSKQDNGSRLKTMGVASDNLFLNPYGASQFTLDALSDSTVSGSAIKLELKTHNMNTATGSTTNNTLYPQYRIYNTGTETVSLSDITLRYYYTVDGERPQNFFTDWFSAGANSCVTGRFAKLTEPAQTADYYVEVGFTGGAGDLEPGKYIETHTRIGKDDWSVFKPGNDYSQNLANEFTYFDQVDMFYKGKLVWGKGSLGSGTDPVTPTNPAVTATPEPQATPTPKPQATPTPEPKDYKLTLQMYNTGNSGKTANTIHPMMRLLNTGNQMVKYSDITIRYYYTADDNKPQNFWCDWSDAGQNNITGAFHKLTEKYEGADTYLEIGFKEGRGYLGIGASTDLHIRFAKNDWTDYNLTNDYSLRAGESFADWDQVDVFIKGEKVWGKGVLPAEEEEEEEHIDYADTTYTPVRGEMYNTAKEKRSNNLSPRFRIYNTSDENIRLTDLHINYFYTTDGAEDQIFEADWAGIGGMFQTSIGRNNITADFTEVGDSNLATNCVADIGFTGTDAVLKPGDYLELHTRIHRPNWTNYIQTNDYSFNADSTDYEEWNKIAVFVGGKWAFGSLPLTYAGMVDPDPEDDYPVDTKGPFGSDTDKDGNTTYYSYDDSGNITAQVDALGNKTEYTYNKFNQITSETDALGNKTLYGYDSKGNLTSYTDALGNKTEYTYNSFGAITNVTFPDGSSETRTYDSKGNLKSVTDAEGNTLSYTYDSFNRITQTTDAYGNNESYEYLKDGSVTKVTDAYGNTTLSAYNKDGKLTKETDKNGNATKYAYSTATGLLSQVTDALSAVKKYEYDNMGNVTTITAADGGKTTYEYDLFGRTTAETDALGGKTSYAYDKNGNITQEKDALGNTVNYTYDKLNRLSTYTDALGKAYSYEYDALGRTTKEVDAIGGETTYVYDKNGDLTEATDALGNTVKQVYNAVGLLITSIDAEGNQTVYTYDKIGKQLTETDAEGNIISNAYDKNGNLTKEKDALGNTTTYTYDKLNRLQTVKDALGNTIDYQYDANGNKTAETDALGNTTNYTYDTLNQLTKVTDAAGGTTQHVYNKMGQQTKVTDALGKSTTYQYDKNGNQTKITDALGYSSTSTYDSLNHLLTEKDAKGKVTSYTYDSLGNLITEKDPKGNTTTYVYDSLGQLTKVTDALGQKAEYTYNKAGNLVKTVRLGETTAKNQTTSYQYNKNGQLLGLTDSLGQKESYAYDGNGRKIKETAKDNTVTCYNYDKAGNLLTKKYSDGKSVAYTYDALSRVKTMTDWTGTASYEYDALGQTQKVTDSKNRNIRYTWTKTGEKDSMTYPDGSKVSYVYDKAGNMTGVIDTNDGNNTYTYDALGQVTAKKLANGAESLYTYDSTGLLTQRQEKTGGAVKETYSYSYDANGNRTKEASVKNGTTKTITYTYDALDQLTKVVDGSVTRNYSYDEFNNRSSKEESGKSKITYSYNTLNQLTEENQGTKEKGYTYGKKGNLSQVKENGKVTKNYTFNSAGMLSKVVDTDTSTTSSYVYDGAGNRVSSEVRSDNSLKNKKEYVIDTQSAYGDIVGAIDTTEGGNTKTSYITYGKGLVSTDNDGIMGYYWTDEKNTVTDILDKTGAVKASLSNDEFGKLLSKDGVDKGNTVQVAIFAFTGHVYDDNTGLYYAKARYYDAEIGRFISEDSYKGDNSIIISLNLYIYTSNNPVINIDPTGHVFVNTMVNDGGSGHGTFDKAGQGTNISNPDNQLLAYERDILNMKNSKNPLNKAKNFAKYLWDRWPGLWGHINKQNALNMGMDREWAKLAGDFSSTLVLEGFTTATVSGVRAYKYIKTGEIIYDRDIALGSGIGNLTKGAGKVTVRYGDEAVSVYRGGNNFTIKPGEIKVDKVTGIVKDTHGVSLNVNPSAVSKYGGAYKIDSLPDGLKIIQQGKNVEHYVIVPSRSMGVDEFQGLLNQIKTSPIK